MWPHNDAITHLEKTTMTKYLVSAALLASVVSANAADTKTNCITVLGITRCSSHTTPTIAAYVNGGGDATVVDTRSGSEKRADAKAKEEKIAKWEAFCQPAKQMDSEGIVRLTYAHKGCEFGRDE
jgi:hypothetical protein